MLRFCPPYFTARLLTPSQLFGRTKSSVGSGSRVKVPAIRLSHPNDIGPFDDVILVGLLRHYCGRPERHEHRVPSCVHLVVAREIRCAVTGKIVVMLNGKVIAIRAVCKKLTTGHIGSQE